MRRHFIIPKVPSVNESKENAQHYCDLTSNLELMADVLVMSA